MKIIVLWNEQTDYASEVREWLKDFEHETAHNMERLEQFDPETVRGEDFARAYDILQYPAVVVTDDEGRLTKMWKGTPMPQIDEVAYWASGE